MTAEEWRWIPGFEGSYQVSDHGRVRSFRNRRAPGRLISASRGTQRGYLMVNLTDETGPQRRYVHALVLAAFVGPRPPGMQIRHLDGLTTNAHLSNLAYGTARENAADLRRHGTQYNVNKTHCPSGHPYDEENTYIPPSRPGWRYCRACNCQRDRLRYRR